MAEATAFQSMDCHASRIALARNDGLLAFFVCLKKTKNPHNGEKFIKNLQIPLKNFTQNLKNSKKIQICRKFSA